MIEGSTRATGTNRTGLNATTGVTISWWHRPLVYGSAVAPNGGIINQASTANASRDGYSVGYNNNGQILFTVSGSAGTTNTAAFTGTITGRQGRWHHYAVTFNDANNQVALYINAKLIGVGTNTRDMTANAACTTTLFSNTFTTNTFYGCIFDLQLLPDTVVPAQDIGELMDPRMHITEAKGRYFGMEYAQVGLSGTIVDESGNGNNLTMPATGTPYFTWPEPPFRFTIA
jgi:hypothetical protein